jgi:tetratricopeptide (TPR) repeat protein
MKIIRSNSKGPTEKLFHHLAQKEFSSEGEMKSYVNSIMGQSLDDLDVAEGKTPLDQAQFLIYDAWEESKPKKRIALAQKALKISPDCADAYNILAEEAAESPAEVLELYCKGVEAGRRALGETFFIENKGHFWGMHQTRPFMRGMAGKAEILFEIGEPAKGFAVYYEMLDLNPGDNQGVRYLLLSQHGERMEYDAMAGLIKRYSDDASAEWVFTAPLLTFQKEGDTLSSKEPLHKAMGYNLFVADYLLGRSALPDDIPDQIAMGEESEAQSYVDQFLPVWQKVDGALLWLECQEKTYQQMKAVAGKLNRNDPCICGSGRKQKKCCGA